MTRLRIGQGYDVHRLVEGRELWLGGVHIEHTVGLLGHSDADVAIHAVCDALLGAAALRDIGYHFPDSDPRYRGIDSRLLLRHVTKLLADHHFHVVNVDLTIIAQQPRLNPFVPAMVEQLSSCMNCTAGQVSVKATTTEGLAFTGRGEGIAAMAVALIEQEDE